MTGSHTPSLHATDDAPGSGKITRRLTRAAGTNGGPGILLLLAALLVGCQEAPTPATIRLTEISRHNQTIETVWTFEGTPEWAADTGLRVVCLELGKQSGAVNHSANSAREIRISGGPAEGKPDEIELSWSISGMGTGSVSHTLPAPNTREQPDWIGEDSRELVLPRQGTIPLFRYQDHTIALECGLDPDSIIVKATDS